MSTPPRGFRQPRCPGCGLTAAACVCSLFDELPCRIAISVVMSSAEARSASNSARLLSLWLPSVELHVRGGEGRRGAAEAGGAEAGARGGGDARDAEARGAEDAAARGAEAGRVYDPEPLLARPGSALLFPGGGRAAPLPSGVQHLIVPDGTWAQARRIERRWFAPHGLPRVELEGAWPSLYDLRRGRQGVCTFEATAIALGLLYDRALAEALLARFACWAARARWLKAGGASPELARLGAAPTGVEAEHGPTENPPASAHPAAELLRWLPPGSADATRALAARGARC